MLITISLCAFLIGADASQANGGVSSTKPTAPVFQPWQMHHISDDFLIANSLFPADINKDGWADLGVIDEASGEITLLLHPGSVKEAKNPWRKVVISTTQNPEYSCLTDLDGDSNYDIVVVEGDDNRKGFTSGIRIFFGPPPQDTTQPTLWIDAGYVPNTSKQQYLYCLPQDINQDGVPDIVYGGRRHPITRTYLGLCWLETPTSPEKRRDLSAYNKHIIDPDTPSGHGFIFADVNEDGHMDIVDANADWDTSLFDQQLYWYENPGPQSSELVAPWKKHVIWNTTEFYAKPQIGLGDIDRDGHDDLVTQTQNFIYIFLKRKNQDGVQWERVRITKPELIQWVSRPIKCCDLDNDGILDILGALIHNDGNLPKEKAAVFWMKLTSPSFSNNWDLFPIKWSDGYNSRDQWIGEKWDHLIPVDIDGDHDLDIVGNVEEHYHWVDGRPRSFFSVVWFENPLNQPPE